MNLKELAESLGLSQTTVSRALNGYPEVNEATRKRVKEAADTAGYRPNTRARSLATGRAMTIGHVIPVSTKHEMVNPIFADFIAGAGEAYAAAGYDMTLCVVPDDREDEVYHELAQKRSVDGIIVHGPRIGDHRIALLNQLNMPFVVHGRSSRTTEPYCWVDVNNRRAFRRATDFLLDLGHRQIALINGLEEMDFALRRREGYLRALRDRRIEADQRLLHSGEMTETFGYNVANTLLDSDSPPTAFLASSLIMALGIRRALSDRGLRMGKDVSIITHDDVLGYLPNGDDVPVYTATRSSVREAGRLAATTLLDRIANPDDLPHTHLLEAELTVGGSTGPVKSPALAASARD